MKLYNFELSGNCYKVRLLCSFLGLEYETVPVDLEAGEQKEDWFQTINPRGQVPVLEDDGEIIVDSFAIMTYLARRYDPDERWFPRERIPMIRVMEWAMVGHDQVRDGLVRSRAALKYGHPWDLEVHQPIGEQALSLLDGRLDDRDWLALEDRPTVADLNSFPYVALAHEGGFSLQEYPALEAWVERIADLPGFITMPGLPDSE